MMEKENIYDAIGKYSDLLKKYFERELSVEERKQLARWLWNDRKNRILFQRLKSARSLKGYYQVYRSIDPEKEYKQLVSRSPRIGSRQSRFGLYGRWIAAVLFLIAGATWFLSRSVFPEKGDLMTRQEKYAAILKTSAGEVFHLGGQSGYPSSDGLLIKDSLNEWVCTIPATADTTAYQQLEIPRGGEYRLILADGTKVWLNSESMIRFPLRFGRHCREIEVSGEVYLEVHKESARPFRIIAGEGRVEVLGTSFGMCIYPEEQTWSTTLVEGKVSVSMYGRHLLLEPGKMAYVQNGELYEKKVDTDKELAWTRGVFIFEHDSLEEVVKKLARWYDTRFCFENEALKQYVFTGQVSRDMGVDRILDLIERMNVVSFEKKEDYFFIKEKAGEY